MRWQAKALIQGTMSVLPKSHRWNALFQRYVTKTLVLSERQFERKLEQTAQHVDNFLGSSALPKSRHALELGTGWHPIVPLGLWLWGADEVTSVDKTPLLNAHRVRTSMEKFVAYSRSGRLGSLWGGRALDEKRLHALEMLLAEPDTDPREPLADRGLRFLEADARSLPFGDGSIDLFTSNDTFEHVPLEIIEGILKEYNRLASADAVMSHYVNMTDHYSGVDRSITAINYLRYPERRWRFFNNKLQYQNRGRLSEYRNLLNSSGFSVVSEVVEKADASVLEGFPLDEGFAGCDEEDLLAVTAFFVARKDPAKGPVVR